MSMRHELLHPSWLTVKVSATVLSLVLKYETQEGTPSAHPTPAGRTEQNEVQARMHHNSSKQSRARFHETWLSPERSETHTNRCIFKDADVLFNAEKQEAKLHAQKTCILQRVPPLPSLKKKSKKAKPAPQEQIHKQAKIQMEPDPG